MTQGFYKILSNVQLTGTVYKMVLEGDTSAITASGQFVNIKLEGKFLRRPISICDYDEATITLVYKVVGVGTEQMSEMTEGQVLDVLVGLGNGYSLDKCGDKPLLIGGGVGVPPLYN
ncbi:MAG: dihydroorotate dehydrogenase electron transfer subunit, partial [Clostridia bacterium]|nr:dihydroorotate dehydrogenase electron transfer subunit [Clostridia bacterium]